MSAANLGTDIVNLDHTKLQEKITNLATALESKIPGFSTILEEVHKILANDIQSANLLTPAEIGIIVRGLKTKTNIVLVEKVAKSKKSLKNMTESDF